MTAIGVLVMAYGGPNNLEEVPAYLQDVQGGRPTRPEIVREVRDRYRQIGGRSPILDLTRAQADALQNALRERATGEGWIHPFKVFVGMRHWHPYIKDTLKEMEGEGIRHAVGLVMAPHYSRMSIGAYYKKVLEAESSIDLLPVERWHLCPGYLDALHRRVQDALERFPAEVRSEVPIIFTAHSLPARIREGSDPYQDELLETVEELKKRLRRSPGGEGSTDVEGRCHFAFQSAAMTPDRWLGPDAGEIIDKLACEGKKEVLIAPIGFVCEHVEILYDIDIKFRQRATSRGMRLERIEMLNDAPAMIVGLAGLMVEKAREKGWL